jgi:hypothetical protein
MADEEKQAPAERLRQGQFHEISEEWKAVVASIPREVYSHLAQRWGRMAVESPRPPVVVAILENSRGEWAVGDRCHNTPSALGSDIPPLVKQAATDRWAVASETHGEQKCMVVLLCFQASLGGSSGPRWNCFTMNCGMAEETESS